MKVADAIVLPVSKEVINKTLKNTVKKYLYTYKSLMYARTPVELLDNLFMGDFAKNCIFDYLKNKCDGEIVDYDEIRTDDFKEHDPGWDFLIGNKKIKVEVKSSIPPKGESVNDIIDKRDIKITASHDNGNTWIKPEDIESDIHIQIYFYAQTYKNGWSNFESLYNHIKDNPNNIINVINASKYYKPYFMGWNTKDNIIKYSKELKPNTWTFTWTSRIYWRCPIISSYNIEKLIELINDKKNNSSTQQNINTNTQKENIKPVVKETTSKIDIEDFKNSLPKLELPELPDFNALDFEYSEKRRKELAELAQGYRKMSSNNPIRYPNVPSNINHKKSNNGCFSSFAIIILLLSFLNLILLL